MTDFEKARKDPAGAFHHPTAVLRAGDLSKAQKIEILRQWEYDARQLQVATEENMPSAGDNDSKLGEVREALESLGESEAPDPGATKFG